MTERSSRGSSRGSDRGGKRYEYQERSADAYKKRGDQGGSQFDSYLQESVKVYKPHDGDNIVRILPPTWDKPEHFGFDLYLHYEVGPDKETYICLDKMKGEPCPVCEERKRAQDDGDEEYAAKLKPNKRVCVWLIDRKEEKEGPMLWPMSWTIDRDICKLVVDKRSGEVLPIDHPEEGYDIEFERKGKGMRTEYLGIAVARRSSDLGDDRWLDYVADNPLPEVLQYFSYEHIAAKFAGQAKPEEGKDDRGGRGRDSKEKDKESDDRGGRGRDREERSSSRGRDREPEAPTWDSVHKMTWDEMVDLSERETLKIDCDSARDEEDLADWICELLKLEKEAPARRGTSRDETKGEPDHSERMRKLREESRR